MDPQAPPAASERLWYFGYGSNMSRTTFVERRKIQPGTTRAARLAGYRLCFNIPVGSGERGVANILIDPSAEVWGVAYEITAAEFEHLDQTEGVQFGLYRRILVNLTTSDAGSLAAVTYQSAVSSPGRKPSPRYMGLLLAGARENNLPVEYLRYLEAIELGHDEREQRKAR
jgi:cation transport regulator ChaC